MKPPKCEVCNRSFRPVDGKSGGIYFKETAEEKAYNKKMREDKKVGHPMGYGWFCDQHYAQAKKLKDGHLWDAIKEIKSRSSKSSKPTP